MNNLLNVLRLIREKVEGFLHIGSASYKKKEDKPSRDYTWFKRHELRPFLEAAFTMAGDAEYSVITVHGDADLARDFFLNGVGGVSGRWIPALTWVRDNEATIVVSKDITMDMLLEKACIKLESDNWLKVSKYLKRLMAPYRWFAFYHERSIDMKTYQYAGEIITPEMREAFSDEDIVAIVDGMNLVSQEFAASVLGFLPDIGTVWQGTVFWRGGFSKGHYVVVDDIAYDIVNFLPKTELKWDTENIFVGFINPVEGKHAHTDIQTVTNLQLWDFLSNDNTVNCDPTRTFCADLIFKMREREGIEELLGLANIGTEYEPRHSLEEAISKGVDVRDYPFLMGRLRRLFQKKLGDTVKKIRIPWPTQAVRRYVLPDMTVFDRCGRIDNAGLLTSGEIFVTGRNYEECGELFHLHRQPNAVGELIWGVQCQLPGLEAFNKAGNAVMLSPFDMRENLAICGGGDCDDGFLVYTNSSINRHLSHIPQRKIKPATHKVESPPVTMTRKDQILSAISKMADADGIGRYVNALIVDHANTLYLEGYTSKLENMSDNLETIIDSFVKDDSCTQAWADERDLFWELLETVPEFLLNRVPPSHRERMATYTSPPDETIRHMQSRLDKFEKVCRQDVLRKRPTKRFDQNQVDQKLRDGVTASYFAGLTQFTRENKKGMAAEDAYKTWVNAMSQHLGPFLADRPDDTIRVLADNIYNLHWFKNHTRASILSCNMDVPDKILGHPDIFPHFLELT